jgi:hypothetical protein
MSDVDTGHRMVADMGNVQNNTSWLIHDLPPGTYYWSVQAVDQSFQGSAWAEEAIFDVSTADKALVGSESGQMPDGMEVVDVYPNPIHGTVNSAVIQIRIGAPQMVRVSVFSALGSHVATLAEEYFAPGVHRVSWNGRSSVGDSVSDGVYFVRIVGEGFSRAIPLVRTGS